MEDLKNQQADLEGTSSSFLWRVLPVAISGVAALGYSYYRGGMFPAEDHIFANSVMYYPNRRGCALYMRELPGSCIINANFLCLT